MDIFDPDVIRRLLRQHYLLFALGVLICAFLVTYYLIPKVLWVCQEKKLFKPIIGRSVHHGQTPTMGGVAFFTVFVLMFSILQSFHKFPTGNHLIAAMTIMFMVGLKDDLLVSTPRVKLVGQLVAAGLIIFSPEMKILSLHGFLGIGDLAPVAGYLIAAVLIVALINAYNFIDGIDGLASIIGIVICGFYGIGFYLTGRSFFAMICLVVIGALLAYLPFNFGHSRRKIFMGDSGSLSIGLILGCLTVKMIGMKAPMPIIEQGEITSLRCLLVLSVISLLVFDLIRVMILRITKGKSPFVADRQHIHYVLLRLGWSHAKTAIVIGLLNVIIVIGFGLLSKVLTIGWLCLAMIVFYGLIFLMLQMITARTNGFMRGRKTNMKPQTVSVSGDG